MPAKHLGAYFLDQRKRAGLTREQVCEHIESLTISDLALFEEGYGNLPMSTIMALANILNSDPAEILSLINDETQRAAILADDQVQAVGDDSEFGSDPKSGGRRIH